MSPEMAQSGPQAVAQEVAERPGNSEAAAGADGAFANGFATMRRRYFRLGRSGGRAITPDGSLVCSLMIGALRL
jgi:hypothetical protein